MTNSSKATHIYSKRLIKSLKGRKLPIRGRQRNKSMIVTLKLIETWMNLMKMMIIVVSNILKKPQFLNLLFLQMKNLSTVWRPQGTKGNSSSSTKEIVPQSHWSISRMRISTNTMKMVITITIRAETI
jgi:hypothetical protein